MGQIDAYLDALASASPTPGGGSAATLVGAMGAALCAMVARITADAPRHLGVHAQAREIVEEADRLRERFAAARPLDEAAYGAVVTASGMPRRTDEEKRRRTDALQAALIGAAEAPLAAAGLCAEGAMLAQRTLALGNTHLVSDVECAAHFFRAALAASAANVRINHQYIGDESAVRDQSARLAAIASHAHAAIDAVLASTTP
ncbi:formiminotransferase-cyclodeaminase [Vulcanimicrobium alpinum]|uniref:Formiminotransferase-cyclodeaminase n=1 Tax=Vulcanimicrobium alpinum TaxID=3016050 RepID=A0AAN1XYE4_UNVUL|nr:cyclodeaminase/cyclohydrolase family protein [Vulcanimicrobium alpinum]BDE06921.1 formiminotransferase-cyclodeaminase [Vulcanimicrobium alpinum]